MGPARAVGTPVLAHRHKDQRDDPYAPLGGLAAAVALAAMPATAHAHVTLQPDEVRAGGFERVDVRVPNERDDARTTKVEVKFPPGFIFIWYGPEPGWSARVKMARLDEPVEAYGERHSEQVATVTFTTRGEGIRPGQFQDFGLSLGIPDRAGTALTFKALQTYSSGEVVRWIGEPDAEQPAPQVRLAAAEPEGDAAAHGAGQDATTQQPAAAAATPADAGGGDALSLLALVVGALGLVAGWPAWRPPAAPARRRPAERRGPLREAAHGSAGAAGLGPPPGRRAGGRLRTGAGGARRRARARRADPHDAAPGRDRRAVPPYR